MASAMQNTVYNELLNIMYDYLGPAAERFLNREIEAHLGKKPWEITRDDVIKIHDWSRLAIALLAEDEKTVKEFSQSLLAVANRREGTSRH